MTQKIVLYDTTLRDGTQAEDVNLSTPDKIKIALRLDEFGIDYIEGGWPGSNPVDVAFFKEIANYHLKHARIAAFGSTHHPDNTAEADPNLNALIASGATAGTIFGKSCERHAKEALRLDPKRNLDIIRNSVAYLKRSMPEVYFDAEHFFDGYKRNAEYSLAVLRAAHEAGALIINLCDTNGGTLPNEIRQIVSDLRVALPEVRLGIHTHNDCEMAVANTIAAVQSGAEMVQGTINGVGERCGNANLCSIIPVLQVKCGLSCLPEPADERLRQLSKLSSYFAEVANMKPFNRQPFVGNSAFAHKGGVHVSAVNRCSSVRAHGAGVGRQWPAHFDHGAWRAEQHRLVGPPVRVPSGQGRTRGQGAVQRAEKKGESRIRLRFRRSQRRAAHPAQTGAARRPGLLQAGAVPCERRARCQP